MAKKPEVATLQSAIEAHAMVKNVVDEVGRVGVQLPSLDEAWGALVGNPLVTAAAAPGLVAESVLLTVPPDYVPMLRSRDAVAAAFALCAIAKRLIGVDLKDDLAIRRAIRMAWDDFEQRRQEANEVEEGYGCDESEAWSTLRQITPNYEQMAEHRIIEIAKYAGRMFRALKSVRLPTPNDDPQNVVGAEMGGDPSRLLASEIALLASPATADLAAIKILERQALQNKMRGEAPTSRGPIVIALDESGSMHEEEDWRHNGPGRKFIPGRNTWAKGCMIALVRLAWSEGRAARVVHFSTATHAQELPKDDQVAMFEASRHFFSGGTHIANALRRALEQVGDMEANGHKGADIVLVSDGADHTQQEQDAVLDVCDQRGVKLWSVAIGEDFHPDLPIRKRAAKYIYATDDQLHGAGSGNALAFQLRDAALDDRNNKPN